MLATDAKTQKIETDPNLFYDRRKFRRQNVNIIDTTWGRIYFSQRAEILRQTELTTRMSKYIFSKVW